MTLPDVTYADYEALHLPLSEEAFLGSLEHAKAAVKNIIGFNEPIHWFQIEAYKKAVCMAVDVDAMYGGTGGAGEGTGSFSIGKYSETAGAAGSGSEATSYELDMERAIRGALVGTGLLCQVIR